MLYGITSCRAKAEYVTHFLGYWSGELFLAGIDYTE